MKKLNKFLVFVVSVFLLGSCMFLSACNKEQNGKILLDKTNVSIVLGQTENNTVSVVATLENFSANSLELIYEPSNYFLVSQTKTSDNTFLITIKANSNIALEPTLVEVKSGNVKTSFNFELVLPIENLSSKSDLYIPFFGTTPNLGEGEADKTTHNLKNFLTFEPADTKQTDVSFEIKDEIKGASIEGNNLVIDNTKFEASTQQITVVATSKIKPELSTTLNIAVVPNIKLIADKMQVTVDYNNEEDVVNKDGYSLTLSNLVNDAYEIQTFKVTVKVPNIYGIDVDLNTASGSISDILSCLKTSSTQGGDDVYTFVFKAVNAASQGKGSLKFNYSYKKTALKTDENLFATFLCYQNNQIVESVNVDVVLPITSISCKINGENVNANNTYTAYVNHGVGTLGERLEFGILPQEVIFSRKKITLTLKKNSNLQVIKSDGTVLLEGNDQTTTSATINADEVVYVKGNTASNNSEQLTYSCESNTNIKGTIDFEIKNGITTLGFVESTDSTTTQNQCTVYGFKSGTNPSCIIYAYGAVDPNEISVYNNADPTKELTVTKDKDYYFNLNFPTGQSGTYTIKTKNGHTIQAEVILFEELQSANISLKNNIEFLSGVGDYKEENGNLVNISIKNGYAVELKYTLNNNATYEKVEYSFYEPGVGVYSTAQIKNLKQLKKEDGSDLAPADFSKIYSSYVNTQGLNNNKLISSIKAGITIIKIDFFDKKIENGKIVGAADAPITKYLFVEIYDAVKSIESTAKNITLRAKNQLSTKTDLAKTTINLSAMSNANRAATYNKVFIQGANVNENADGTMTFTKQNSDNTKNILTATLTIATGKLEITANNYDKNETTITIELFAADFIDFGAGITADYTNLKSFVKYVVIVNIIETKIVGDVSITNLDLQGITESTKTYKQIYIDLSKNDAKQFKLNFEITPAEALEKELEIEFSPTNNTSKDILSITPNGTITVLGNTGGTGIIEITPKDTNSTAKKVLVPIVVADGESYATAFEITSLSEIKDSSKHYVLTIPTTYIHNETNFLFSTFYGGLYGKRYSDDTSSACATIQLTSTSLFKTLGADAHIENLNICGTVTQTDNTVNIGFVAETNNGTIKNVNVTTYIYNNQYVPSVLIAKNENPGGLVGTNIGTISNCCFAGSIDVSDLTNKTANAIAGTNLTTTGTISDCKIIIAKFNINDSNKVVETTDTTTNQTIYINGVIGGGSKDFSDKNSTDITTENYEDKALGTISVKETTEKSYGHETKGIVFYYQAKDSSKQSLLNGKNTIALSDLLSSTSTSIKIDDLKVRALNKDGSACNFVSVSANSITLYGVGEFVLEVSSQYDFTTSVKIDLVSMHYFSNFTITHNGNTISSSTNIQIVVGQTAEIITKLNHSISVSGVSIELVENTFDVVFGFVFEQTGIDGTTLDIKNYITNTKLGVHTINMDTNFVKSDDVGVYVELTSNHADFNTLINGYLCLSSTDTNFTITRKTGTTEISANVSHGEIEPKDTFSFVATLTTDAEGDKVTEADIKVLNAQNLDVTQFFNIKVQQSETETNKFEVFVELKEDNKAKLNMVDKTYTIVVGASNSNSKYDVSTTLTLTILPQAVSNINTTLYKVTNATTEGVSVSRFEEPASVLLPTQSGIFVVDMFPTYATYDYIEIVAESSTLTTLAFRLQENNNSSYKNATEGFESINGKNGIRIFNNQTGAYFVKIYASINFDADTVFTLTVNAYYNGKKIENVQSVFILYVKAPEAPEISLNGETHVYVYAEAKTEISNITALVAGDQINTSIKIATIDDDGNEKSELDGKPVGNIECIIERLNNNAAGYSVYNITLRFKDGYSFLNDSTQLKLVVESTKISQGNEIKVHSEMFVYVIDAKIEQDDIVVYRALDKNFNVTNFNASEFMLSLSENVKASANFKKEFNATNENATYYFENVRTGFIFGATKSDFTSAHNLASYLYFVNGNSEIKLTNENDGSINQHEFYDNYVKFFINNEKLYVQGGAYTGKVNMRLRIPYTMPNGSTGVYVYDFTITNNQYTTEDLPKEIADPAGFLNISNEEQSQDYILNADLFLYNFKTIENTNKIKSLDGNNHAIHIIEFAQDSTLTDYALFKQISSETTIKNLTVNIYYLPTLSVQGATTINVAGLAINNNGVVYNCDVMSYLDPNLASTTNSHGLKIEDNVEANVAGLVLNNYGSITNSRVGNSSKTIVESVSDIGIAETKIITAEQFEIKASGTISGFVQNNSGVISSSFVKNINIQNIYNKQETKTTTGFVGENTGTIVMSYAQGGFKDENSIQSDIGGIEALGIMSGFVYSNQGTITDCYSNLRLTNSRSQVGRLGAGFVYENGEDATIKRAYSASTIINNNITQMNFAGIKDIGGYNNSGVIDTCYYYVKNDSDQISIESVINTSITAVSEVDKSRTFYGFSFIDSSINASGTWAIAKNGPVLVNTNNIAQSIRYKKANTTGQNTDVEYLFPYCVGYELGTINNPIIIRDAEEFNSVFGASKSTDIKNNYSTEFKKIYGSYRIVNNLDMLSLVPKSEQETEYKVNLLSTGYVLTGEQKSISKMGGSLEGNGLTIKNLAISNSSATSDEFGLFRALESGASISNLNIELSEGGVSADHTTFVGTIAGTLKNSSAFNISIKANSLADTDKNTTKIIGANVTGGVFGRVIGTSNVSNIIVDNISVTSTNHTSISCESEQVNIYDKTKPESSYTELSIAGGAFGVVDFYRNLEEVKESEIAKDQQSANIINIHVSGGLVIQGMTAGGVIGHVGSQVIARDLALTIKKDKIAKINAYNCYAGGVVGFSSGYLYQIKAEHESEWQDLIEKNMQQYYKVAGGDSTIDRGLEDIFESNVGYKPFAIGGLVGGAYSGKLSIGYSKINVINQYAKNAGGIVGYSYKINQDSDELTDDWLILNEIYAIGDVYSNAANAKIGGIFGKCEINGDKVAVNKDNLLGHPQLIMVNALNYWGHNSYEKFKDPSYKNIGGILGDGAYFEESTGSNTTSSSIYTIKKVQFEGEGDVAVDKSTSSNSAAGITSYYSYPGIISDDGATIDLMFKENGWYKDKNWSRDFNETFPHINYIYPTSTYIIESVNDFYKFILHGNEDDAIFLVKGDTSKLNDDEILIDCSNWYTTLGVIRGDIYGATNKDGFKNLHSPLFTQAQNCTISDLILQGCASPLVISSNNVTYQKISLINCRTSYVYNGNSALLTATTQGGKFEGISFDSDCQLTPSQANNAGLLFGAHTGSEVTIQDILINSNVIVTVSTPNTSNSAVIYGLLFGSGASATISNVNINGGTLTVGPNSGIETSIGLVAGSVTGNITISSLNISNNVTLEVEGTSGDSADKTIYIGGLVGDVKGTFTLNGKDKENPVYYAFNISVSNLENYKTLYLGNACGHAKTLTINGLIVFGAYKDNNLNYVFKPLTIDTFASTNNYIGGVAGGVENVSTTDASNPGYVAYYGDLTIDVGGVEQGASNTPITVTYLNIGGAYGTAGTTGSGSICNTIYEGTIGFKVSETGKQNKYEFSNVNVGGIVGFVSSGNSLTISNCVASGELNLPAKNIGTQSVNQNFAGIVGFAAKEDNANTSITFEKSAGNTKVIALTTVFATTQSDSLDAVIKCATGVALTGNAQYCSAVTLSVSSQTSITTNCDFGTFTQDLTGGTDSRPEIIILLQDNAPQGSKLNAMELDDDSAYDQKPESGSTDEVFYKQESTDKHVVEYGSTKTRKLYINLGDAPATWGDISPLDYQISLNNAILFSAGAEIWSNHTPFNTISETSAVSGVVARVYIDESGSTPMPSNINLNNASSAFTNAAGFVNTNNGIVYVCSVQETLNVFNTGNTQFQAYLNNNVSHTSSSPLQIILPDQTKVEAVAGFVHKNTGYVFGSNTNIKIQTNKESVTCHGFVAENSGTIEFSYASGINNGYVSVGKVTQTDFNKKGELNKQHTLFAPVAYTVSNNKYIKSTDYSYNINNCYTIVMAKGVGIDANLPTGVVGESDACEITIKDSDQDKTIYETSSYVNGSKDYFACNSLYNHNYPTISGGPFAGITYSKRVTMLERQDDSSQNTPSGASGDGSDPASEPSTSTSTPSSNDSTIVFKGLYANDLYTTDLVSGQKTLKPEASSTYYFTIPNLTVLKKLSGLMTIHSKFVLINDINVCYTGDAYSDSIEITGNTSYDTIIEGMNNGLYNLNLTKNLFHSIGNTDSQNPQNTKIITIQNLKFGAIVLQGATGIIGTIGPNATLDNINLEDYTEPKEIKLSDNTLSAGDTVSVATITSTSAGGYYGVLASINNGTIKNSAFKIDISAKATHTSTGYTLGGFVGQNSGTVESSTFSGAVTVIEESLDESSIVVFGAFIGENLGTAERLSLKQPSQFQTLHVTESGDVLTECIEQTNDNKGPHLMETDTNSTTIQGSCIKEYTSQIFVKTSGYAYVGGIVGINGAFSTANVAATQVTKPTRPLIEQCYTAYSCGDNQYAVFVGDERYQMVAYAGGVVGFSNSGTIKNCANISNVAAMSVWQKTTPLKNTTKTTTTGSGDDVSTTTETISVYAYSLNSETGLVEKTQDGTSRVYYDDAVSIDNVIKSKGTSSDDLASIYNMFTGGTIIDLSRIPIYKAFFEKITTKSFKDDSGYFSLIIEDKTANSSNKIIIANKNVDLHSSDNPTGWDTEYIYDNAKRESGETPKQYNYYLEYPINSSSAVASGSTQGYKFTITKISASENGVDFTITMTQGSWDDSYNFEESQQKTNNSKFSMKFRDKTVCRIIENESNSIKNDWWDKAGLVYAFDFKDENNVQEYLARYFSDYNANLLNAQDYLQTNGTLANDFTFVLSGDGTLGYYFNGAINIYQERSALAYAGGIAGGMSSDTTYTQVAVYGNVNAGYRAIKPIENITAKNVGSSVKKSSIKLPWLFLASAYSGAIEKYFAVKAFREEVSKISTLLDTPTFYLTKYLGTSPRFMTKNKSIWEDGLFNRYAIFDNSNDLKFINVSLGSLVGYNSENCQERMEKFFVDVDNNIWGKTYYGEGIGWYKKNKWTFGKNYYHGFKKYNTKSTWKYEDADTSKILCFNYIFGNHSDSIVPVIGTGASATAVLQSSGSGSSTSSPDSSSAEIYVDSNITTYTQVTEIQVKNAFDSYSKSYNNLGLIKLTELSGSNVHHAYYYYTSVPIEVLGEIVETNSTSTPDKNIIVDVSRIINETETSKLTLKYNKDKSTTQNTVFKDWKNSNNNNCWTLINGHYIPETQADLFLSIVDSDGTFPDNTIGIVNEKSAVTITNEKSWNKLVNTLNDYNNNVKGDNNKIDFSSIYVTVNLNNNQTEINVGDNLINEFNGTIKVLNFYTIFKKVVLSTNNNDTALGFIKSTTGCTLENITISGVNINSVNGSSSVGLLIGSVVEKVSQSAVTIKNVKINSVNINFKDSTKTNISFGGLIGTVTSGSVTLANVELTGSVELVSGINYAGGFVGNNAGTLSIGETKQTTTLGAQHDLSLKVASSENVYVGGVVGYNNGTVAVNKTLNIGKTTPIIISADVTAPGLTASAGGFVGVNKKDKSINIIEGVTFGCTSKGFSNVGYVLAGFNVLNESGDEFVYPSSAFASKYIAATDDGTLTANDGVPQNITYNSIVSRWICKTTLGADGNKIDNSSSVNITSNNVSGNFTINGITYTISGNNLITNLNSLSFNNLAVNKTETTEETKTNSDGEEETTESTSGPEQKTISLSISYNTTGNTISITETTLAEINGKISYGSGNSTNINAGDKIYDKTTTLTYYLYKTTTSSTTNASSSVVNGTQAYYLAVDKKIEYFKPNQTEAIVSTSKTLEYAIVLNDVNYKVNEDDRYNLEIYQLSEYQQNGEESCDVTITANREKFDYGISEPKYKKNAAFTPNRVYGGLVSDLNDTKILNKLFEDELESSAASDSASSLFNTSGELVLKILNTTIYKNGSNGDVFVNTLDGKIYLSNSIKFNIESTDEDEHFYIANNVLLTATTNGTTTTLTDSDNKTVVTIVTENGTTTYYSGSSTSGKVLTATTNGTTTTLTDSDNKTVVTILSNSTIYYDDYNNILTYKQDSTDKTKAYIKDNTNNAVATITTKQYVSASGEELTAETSDNKITLKKTETGANGETTTTTVATIVTDSNGTTTYYEGSSTSGDGNKLTEQANQDGSISYLNSDGVVFKQDVTFYYDNTSTPLVGIIKGDKTTVYDIVACIDNSGKTPIYTDAKGNKFTSNGETYKLGTNGDTTTLTKDGTAVATITQKTTYLSASGEVLTATPSDNTTTLTDSDNTTVATIVTANGTTTYYNGSNTSGDNNKLSSASKTVSLSCGGLYASFAENSNTLSLSQKFIVSKTETVSDDTTPTTTTEYSNAEYVNGATTLPDEGTIPTLSLCTITLPTMIEALVGGSANLNANNYEINIKHNYYQVKNSNGNVVARFAHKNGVIYSAYNNSNNPLTIETKYIDGSGEKITDSSQYNNAAKIKTTLTSVSTTVAEITYIVNGEPTFTATDGNQTPTTYTVEPKTDNKKITGTYTSSLTIGGEIKIDYNSSFSFGGKNYNYLSVQSYTFNNKTYLVVACIDSNYNVTDYVYLVNNDKFQSCGNITYTLGDNGSDKTAISLITKWQNNAPDRYPSFVPKDADDNIYNIQDNLVQPAESEISTLSITRNWKDVQVDIEANLGDLFYSYTTTYTEKETKIEISYSNNQVTLSQTCTCTTCTCSEFGCKSGSTCTCTSCSSTTSPTIDTDKTTYTVNSSGTISIGYKDSDGKVVKTTTYVFVGENNLTTEQNGNIITGTSIETADTDNPYKGFTTVADKSVIENPTLISNDKLYSKTIKLDDKEFTLYIAIIAGQGAGSTVYYVYNEELSAKYTQLANFGGFYEISKVDTNKTISGLPTSN